MAIRAIDKAAQELARVEPLAQQLMDAIRQADPGATFTLQPPLDPGIWLLDAYLTPPLDGDPDFLAEITERAVDIQLEHGISIAVIPLSRELRTARATPSGPADLQESRVQRV
jgi:hypothetical protein